MFDACLICFEEIKEREKMWGIFGCVQIYGCEYADEDERVYLGCMIVH